jgi:hypothetical protein
VRDELLEQDAQAAEDISAVTKVRTALLEQDEVLQKAREDAATMRTVAMEWETEVASLRTQLEQDRATLKGVRSWQSQAEERAKEAEQLRTSWRTRPLLSPRRRSSFSGSGTRANKRTLSFSRSGPPSLRLGPPSSASA